MEQKSNVAVEIFKEGYSCAQAVVYAFCKQFDVDKDTALKMACGFGAGMGRKGEVCGAVSGGIMVLGLRYGRGVNDGAENKDKTYQQVKAFMQSFAKDNGSYVCRELLNGCDLLTDEGRKQFTSNNLSTTVCVPCVRSAVKILEAMLK